MARTWTRVAVTMTIPACLAAQGKNLTTSASASTHRVDTLQWNLRSANDYRITDRITPRTAMSIRITNFNYLRYQPVFSVDAKTITGYTELESLWTQVLAIKPTAPGQGGGQAVVIARSPFLQALSEWDVAIAQGEQDLATIMTKVPETVALTNDDMATIKEFKSSEDAEPKVLDLKRKAVEDKIFDLSTYVTSVPAGPAAATPSTTQTPVREGTKAPAAGKDSSKKPNPKLNIARDSGVIQQQGAPTSDAGTSAVTPTPNAEAYYAQQLYNTELTRHNALVEKIHTFSAAAGDVVNGKSKDLDSQKAGTIVTTSIRVQPVTTTGKEGALATAQGVTTVSYYVQSTLPLTFHAGAAYTNISAFDIEKVQRPGVGDVYQQITKPGSSADLIAFMTYMLTPYAYDQPGFGLTLGTGVKNLGQRIYIGATAKFTERLLLTGGAFSQTLKQGDVALPDGADLFTSVKNVQKWGWFGALSVTPF